jgi:hypothetical protein
LRTLGLCTHWKLPAPMKSAWQPMTSPECKSRDPIRIKPRCYVRTIDHVISANKSEIIEVKIKTMDWAGEITDLFHYNNKEAIHQVIQGLKDQV